MSDAISTAIARANRSYHSCKQSLKNNGGALVGGVGTMEPNSLAGAADQYRHFSGWVHVAVSAIARRLAGQPAFVGHVRTNPTGRKQLALPAWLKHSGSRIEPLESHALLTALDNPNPLFVRWSLLFSTVASLELTGAAFWWLSTNADGKLEIWPLPASWVEPEDNLRATWRVRPPKMAESFPVSGDDMVFFSLPNPADPFGVSSPLAAQGIGVLTDEAISQSQYRAFRNGIFPSAVITVGKTEGHGDIPGERMILTEGQRRQLVNRLRQYHRGVLNYGEPLILDGLVERVEPYSMKPAEMDFGDSSKLTKSRIMQAYGVNPLIVGEIEGANRAQAIVAERSFLTNVINPLAELISQTVTGWLSPTGSKQHVVFWLEPGRVNDPEQTLKEWDVALRHGAVELNEYRRVILNLPEQDQFAITLQPGHMIPSDSNGDDEP
jgi:HK97 family phage portal protein